MGVIAMRTGVVWGSAGWLCRGVVRFATDRLGELDWLAEFRESLEGDANRIDLGTIDAEAVRQFRACVAELADLEVLRGFFASIRDDAVLNRVRERLLELASLIDRELLDAA